MKGALAILIILAAACGSAGLMAPPTGLAHAVAIQGCGPTDGPAVSIVLTPVPTSGASPAPPYISVTLSKRINEVVGAWTISSTGDGAYGYRVSAPGADMEAAERGTLTVLSVGADSTINGNVDVSFPSIGRVQGGFEARWIKRTYLCG